LTLRDNQQLEHRLRASINAAIITSPRRRTIILIVAASSSRSPRYISVCHTTWQGFDSLGTASTSGIGRSRDATPMLMVTPSDPDGVSLYKQNLLAI
jgi:hypothetical protein